MFTVSVDVQWKPAIHEKIITRMRISRRRPKFQIMASCGTKTATSILYGGVWIQSGGSVM